MHIFEGRDWFLISTASPLTGLEMGSTVEGVVLNCEFKLTRREAVLLVCSFLLFQCLINQCFLE